MHFFLTTARLGFRHWRNDDLPLAQELWSDPEVTRYLGGPFTPDWIVSRLQSEIALQREENMQYWPIFLRENGDHVGCCGVRPYQPGVHELGFHLRKEHWGKGFAAEAAAAVINVAFHTLAPDALFAGHFPENSRSRSVLLRLGFQYDGMKVYPPTGMLEPTYLLHKRHWTALKSGMVARLGPPSSQVE